MPLITRSGISSPRSRRCRRRIRWQRLLRDAPDFRQEAALADALLHPQDRAYSVPQLLDFINGAGLTFGRWVKQAPHSRSAVSWRACRKRRDRAFPGGAIRRRRAVSGHDGEPQRDRRTGDRRWPLATISFSGDAWLDYVPVRLPDTLCVQERLPPEPRRSCQPGHTNHDIYLPIDAQEKSVFDAIDGERSIGEIVGDGHLDVGRALFERLWWHDQVVFDASRRC